MRSLREIRSYALVFALGAILVFYAAPSKTEVVMRDVAVSAPGYASSYMTAICASDASYLIANTSLTLASAADITSSIKRAKDNGFGCASIKYLGRFQTDDKHVFAVVIRSGSSEHETYYVLTFDDTRRATEIE